MKKTTKIISKVSRQTLSEKCYEQIKDSILCHDIMPGERLQEVRLAHMLDVSSAPIREAFRMLAAEGLIRIDPWKGAVVQHYSAEDMRDAVQCRVALESLALKLAYQNMGDLLVQRIEKQLEAADDSNDVSTVVYINSNLHQLWVQGSNNKKLVSFVDQLNKVVLREMEISAYDECRRKEIRDEHTTILRALKAGNIDEAVAALSLHFYNGYYYAIKYEQEHSKKNDNKTFEVTTGKDIPSSESK